MATTIEQQVALDEALLPSTQRLRIRRSNFRLPSDIQSKESTLQVVYDVLRSCPFFKAFLVTADVPEIYMQEFWATAYVHQHSIRFKEAQQLKIVLRRSRQETHISQPSGFGTDEGTGSKPRVLDDEDVDAQEKNRDDDEGDEKGETDDGKEDDDDEKDDDDDDDEEEIAKTDEQDNAERGRDDDGETKSDEESDGDETREEESFDPIPRTPEDSEDDGNSEEDLGLRINSHVTLTPVHPDGQQESSSVSSQFVTSMINLTSDAGMESIFVTASSSVAPLQTSSPIMTPSTIATITSISHAPIPPTTILSEVLQNLPTLDSVFCFDERLKSLEASFSEYRQTNPFAEAVSNILGEGPFAGSDRGSKIQREGKEPKSASALLEPITRSAGSLTELEYHLEEVYKDTTDQLDWVNPEGQQYPYNLLQLLPLIPDNRDYEHIKWIEDLVPRTMWIKEPINYDKHALWGVSHWGRKLQQFYGFAVNRESTLDVYSKRRIIAVIDLKIVEWHNYKHLDWILLSNMTVKECFAFNVSFRMFTRSIIIQRRMEDLQLGVESYQKRLNLTKLDTYRSNLKRREAYTAYSNPRGFIYQNNDKKNRLMRIDKLYKFSDGTLNDVCNALDDRLKGIRMQYLPQTIWRKGDKDKAAAMIQAIDKMLKTRRIMRSLERFVGGRLYEGDFRMLQRTT
nr:hypothetical protein [Tanacetum cinerariifolium]